MSVDSVFSAMSCIDESGRDLAVGRLVRLVTAAACAAIGPAALATPAHAGGTPTLPEGTAVTQLAARGPARKPGRACTRRHLMCSLSSADCRDWA